MSNERPGQAPIVGRPLVYIVGAVTVLVLGLNWPIMSWGLATVPPLWLAALRLLGASLAVAAVLALTGDLRRPPRQDYSVVASVAAIRLALVYGLVLSALVLVPPGRSSVLAHTTALWAVPIGAWILHERPSQATLVALLVGMGGIIVLMEPWSLEARTGAALGYAMLIGAAVANAIATVHVRGHRWEATPLVLMPWQLLVAGLLTLPFAAVIHGPPQFAGSIEETAVIAYQVVLASGFGLWGVLVLARSLPAVTSGMIFMAVPAVGVASSVLLVGEVVTPAATAGIILVFVGVALNLGSDRGRRAQPESAP
jgi:drug/metabolite transporter (DMT)-like permease